MGLLGGGENSMSTGTSGWGTPPTAGGAGWGGANAGPAQAQWGTNRPPGQPPNPNPQGEYTDFLQGRPRFIRRFPNPSKGSRRPI